jgi:type IV secretory pathway VirB2 component (pilin)
MKKILYFLLILFVLVFPVVVGAQVTGSGNDGVTGSGQETKLNSPLAGSVDDINEFIALVINRIIFPIGSVIIVIMIIYTGFKFVMAQGNPSEIESARRMLLYVIIGAAILLGAAAIAAAIKGTVCEIAPMVCR